MVLMAGGGKEVDMFVRCIVTIMYYISECKQVFNHKANVSLVSLIIEIHHAPQAEYRNGRPSPFVICGRGLPVKVIRAEMDPSAEVAYARTR